MVLGSGFKETMVWRTRKQRSMTHCSPDLLRDLGLSISQMALLPTKTSGATGVPVGKSKRVECGKDTSALMQLQEDLEARAWTKLVSTPQLDDVRGLAYGAGALYLASRSEGPVRMSTRQ